DVLHLAQGIVGNARPSRVVLNARSIGEAQDDPGDAERDEQEGVLHWRAVSVARNFTVLLWATRDVRLVSHPSVITVAKLRPSTHKRSLTCYYSGRAVFFHAARVNSVSNNAANCQTDER